MRYHGRDGRAADEGRRDRLEAPWELDFLPARRTINTGSKPLKVYSLYAPPHHRDGTVHRPEADADAAEH